MITEVIVPKLGQTMEEGTIVEWLKQEGDVVQRGEMLFTTESDKAVLEVESTARGFLRKILVSAGQTVPVLTVVGLITRTVDEDISGYQEAGKQEAAKQETREQAADHPAESVTVEPSVSELGTGRIFASPRARKTAREKGMDLALVAGSGPQGRIVEKDVLEFVASRPKPTPVAARVDKALGVDLATVSPSSPGGRITKADVQAAAQVTAPGQEAAVESLPMAGVRRVIAEHMAASHTQTARVTLVTEADATDFVEVRERLKPAVSEDWGFAPGYNDLLGLIVARAVREFPYMNVRLSADGSAIERLPIVNLGLAVDTERGLLVLTIRDADQKGLRTFGAEFRALVERARVGKSLPDDLSGGTFTITNLGMYDIDAFTPIMNLPEAAILGVGRIQPKPVVREGEIVVRQMMTLSLAFDHRLVDGAPAARFLQRIKQLVENPFLLLG